MIETKGARDDGARWTMLVLISLGFLQLTLNWFDVTSAFPSIGDELHLLIPQLALLVSLFFAGYGVLHIPTGFLAARFGLRNVALLGMLLESVGAILTGAAPNFAWLALFRVVTGLGGSLFVGCGFALTVSWFRGRELALAQGLSGGVAFAVGAALGLFPWVAVVAGLGWRLAMVLGGVVGLLVFAVNALWLRTPAREGRQLAAGNLRWDAVGRVLSHPTLWLIGVSVLGGMGSYFVASQLLPTYVMTRFHMGGSLAGLLGAVVVLAGIPGSFLAGYWSDRGRTRKWFIVVPVLIGGIAVLLVPFGTSAAAWVLAVIIGGGGALFAFPAFTAVPGDLHGEIAPPDVATAEGLLLTIIAVGEFLVPLVFGLVAARWGYTAAWVFAGLVTVVFLIPGVLARLPERGVVPQGTFADLSDDVEAP